MRWAFMFIGFAIVCGNLAVFLALRRRVREAWPGNARAATLALGVPMWILLAPSLALMFGSIGGVRAFREYAPIWLGIACMAFQGAMIGYGGALAVWNLPRWLRRRFIAVRRLFNPGEGPVSGEEPVAQNMERRRFLRRVTLAVPAAFVATAGLAAVASQQKPVVTRLALAVRPGYEGLAGLRIVQFSDLHVGAYTSPARLDQIAESINELTPDIVVCTGDFLDNHPSQLAEARRLAEALNPRLGSYMCMGNHDYIASPDPAPLIDGLGEAGMEVILDDARKIEVNGTHLWLIGVDYPRSFGWPYGQKRTVKESLDIALDGVEDDSAPRIVLSHHPRGFHEARLREIDLMLSGHTHGGQIHLGRVGEYAVSPLLPFLLYHKGEYEYQGRRLYVNSGLGSWMPLRIHCPPELTLIVVG